MITIDDIRASAPAREALANSFDFDVDLASDDFSWIAMPEGTSCEVVAGCGSGGAFVACGDGPPETRPIYYLSSEGQAGCVGSSLAEFIAILVAHPYWFDLLKFSGGGNLEHMRKAEGFLAREYTEDNPDESADRTTVLSELDVPTLPDAVHVLHERVRGTALVPNDLDGNEYDLLFNQFTAKDNPQWA